MPAATTRTPATFFTQRRALLLTAFFAASTTHAAIPRYRVLPVEASRYSSSEASHLNESGQVLVTVYDGPAQFAVWSPDKPLRRLAYPAGGASSNTIALHVNRFGAAVGYTDANNDRRGIVWEPDGTMRYLVDAQFNYPSPELIADDGTVIGTTASSGVLIGWAPGATLSRQLLPQFRPSTDAFNEVSISGSGVGVGAHYLVRQLRARPYVRQDNDVHDLEIGGYVDGYANGISEDTQWVSGLLSPTDEANPELQPVRWHNSTLEVLPPLPTGRFAGTNDINSSGVTVGYGSIEALDLTVATMWDVAGKPYDLNTLIDTDLNVHLHSSRGINDAGQILTYGYEIIDGTLYTKSFLLDPISIPEPAAAWVALPAALMLRRRR